MFENDRVRKSVDTNLEVEEYTVSPAPSLPLADNNSGHCYAEKSKSVSHELDNQEEEEMSLRTLLPQFWLSLLHRCNNHITNTSIGQTVQM